MLRLGGTTTTGFIRRAKRSSSKLHLWLSGVLASLVLSSVPGSPADAPASRSTRFPGQLTLQAATLTARISAVPLGQVMAELSRLSGAQVLWLTGGGEEQVSVEFPVLPLAEALARLLGEKNFLLFYTKVGEGERLTQIWISSSAKSPEKPPFVHPREPQGQSSISSSQLLSPSLQYERLSRPPAIEAQNQLARSAPSRRLGSEPRSEPQEKPSPSTETPSEGSSQEAGATVAPWRLGGVASSGTLRSNPCSSIGSTIHVADITGDGRADVIILQADQIRVQRSDGTRFLAPQAWTSGPYSGTGGTYFADVTGDGQADAIAVYTDQMRVRRASTTGLLAHEVWTTASLYEAKGRAFADVDGDGRADAIAVTDMGITIRGSDGTHFLTPVAWTSGPYSGTGGTYFADVDGDGRTDAVAVTDTGITVRRSNGIRFLSAEAWTSRPYFSIGETYFADVDGDGRADAIAVAELGIMVRRSDGAQFLAPQVWTSGPYPETGSPYFSDVDGDGRADAITVGPHQITVRRSTGSRLLPPQVWASGPYVDGLSPLCTQG